MIDGRLQPSIRRAFDNVTPRNGTVINRVAECGFKQSGFGRDRSLHALYKYADLKSVSITIR